MPEELIAKELEITNSKYKYLDLSTSIKKYAGLSVHDLVVALKGEGKSQEINGDNIQSFLGQAKSELIAEKVAEEVIKEEL